MPKKFWVCIFPIMFLFLLGLPQRQIWAQLTVRFIINHVGSAELGTSVAGAGDVNADGTPDFIVGAPYAGEYPNYGEAYVYSGVDRSLLYKVKSAGAGWSVAGAGDVNGDGRADFIVGAPFTSPGGRKFAGSAFVYSGVDGSLLYQEDGSGANDHLGFSVAGAGDVNGDGRGDFMVGAPLARPSGSTDSTGGVYVYSGADGTLIYQMSGIADGDRFGSSVAGAGDVNGDGYADLIVGTPNSHPGGVLNAGSAYVYSGADGGLLYAFTSIGVYALFGFSVAGGAEVNGDGRADFIIGAPGAGDLGRAYVYSGADGRMLFELGNRVGGGGLGHSVATPGDMNGDGIDDFVVGAPGELPEFGAMVIFSGATGARLCENNPVDIDIGYYGYSVSGIGDIDHDGKPDIIVGAPRSRDGYYTTGAAWVYTADKTPPVISCPEDIKVSVCPGVNSAVVGLNVGATDGCPVPDLFCTPPNGSAFPLGVTPVTCIASDVSGNKDTCQFNVTVVAEDRVPPIVRCPNDTFPWPHITVCIPFSDSGRNVAFQITAFDNCSGPVKVDCNPPSGSFFPVGVSPVSCLATDASGNRDSCNFSIEVRRKGDMNRDKALTASDVMLMLNCVFLASGSCDFCFADVNCSGGLSPADVVLELSAVFLASPFPC